MRTITVTLLVVISTCAAISQKKQNPAIESKRQRTFWRFFTSCDGPQQQVIIHGRRFKNVRGVHPYYLPVNEWDSVFFVTDGHHHKAVCHIYNLKTKKHIEIKTDATELGYGIGMNGDGSETIQTSTNGLLSVSRSYGNKRDVYMLSAKDKKMIGIETLVLHGSNVVERHFLEMP